MFQSDTSPKMTLNYTTGIVLLEVTDPYMTKRCDCGGLLTTGSGFLHLHTRLPQDSSLTGAS